ncbi:MAG: uncharacterized protein QG635_1497 [Bacteroidota bacterium]|nr:uncharacterized protein [Bacteroidota bacterium]
MDKIQLIVLGLSASPSSNNAYALILKELDGNRRLPIIIGAFEAQAIALEMEGVIPPRPMTHDLIKSVIDSLGSSLTEIYINELNEGTFYAKLIFEDLGTEVDARPSDAIALAVRCNVPIYVNSDVLDETGLVPQSDSSIIEEESHLQYGSKKSESNPYPSKPISKIEQLQTQLDKAIHSEDYEKAASLRDQIKKILEST